MTHQNILVLDFGPPYTPLMARGHRELAVCPEVADVSSKPPSTIEWE